MAPCSLTLSLVLCLQYSRTHSQQFPRDRFSSFRSFGLSTFQILRHCHFQSVSKFYVDTFRNVYEEVYEVDAKSDDQLDDSLREKYNEFYGITTPEHRIDELESVLPHMTVEKLILLHGIAMNDTDNNYVIGKVRNRTTWAYNPIFPILHSPPEHVHGLLMNLCDWINYWWPRVMKMSSQGIRTFHYI